jgi:hypothetical protein
MTTESGKVHVSTLLMLTVTHLVNLLLVVRILFACVDLVSMKATFHGKNGFSI